MDQQQQQQLPANTVPLIEVATKFPNRRKLYDGLQKVYDLPNFGPAVTTDYLREIMKENSKFLKVPRSETHPVPKGVRRNFHSVQVLHKLILTLRAKGLAECGFTSYAIPNMEWMLRILIFADPIQKEQIFKTTVQDGKQLRKNNLEEVTVNIDPQIKQILESSMPSRSVTNQNYRMYIDSFDQEEQRRINSIKTKIEQAKVKKIKLKIQMERAFQAEVDAEQLLQLYQEELLIKQKKKQIHSNKKLLRKRAMTSLLEGKMPQTPLVDKMFKLQVDSDKKFKSSRLLFGEQNALNMAINNSLQGQPNPMNLRPSDPYVSDDEMGNSQKKPPQKKEISKRRQANLRKQQEKSKRRSLGKMDVEKDG